MGAITDAEFHKECVSNLVAFSELSPHYKRHLAHHIRNPLTGIMLSVHLAEQALSEGRMEEVRNHLARITSAVDHITVDITEAGI